MFFFQVTAATEIYTLSLHDALPISLSLPRPRRCRRDRWPIVAWSRRRASPGPRHDRPRSEEHTSELQSLRHLVCRLLLEKKKKVNRRLRRRNIGMRINIQTERLS